MTGWEKQRQLAQYRMQQAKESLDEARFLLGGGKSARSVINRAYYAMFYAVLALLVYEEFLVFQAQRCPELFQPAFHQGRGL